MQDQFAWWLCIVLGNNIFMNIIMRTYIVLWYQCYCTCISIIIMLLFCFLVAFQLVMDVTQQLGGLSSLGGKLMIIIGKCSRFERLICKPLVCLLVFQVSIFVKWKAVVQLSHVFIAINIAIEMIKFYTHTHTLILDIINHKFFDSYTVLVQFSVWLYVILSNRIQTSRVYANIGHITAPPEPPYRPQFLCY